MCVIAVKTLEKSKGKGIFGPFVEELNSSWGLGSCFSTSSSLEGPRTFLSHGNVRS